MTKWNCINFTDFTTWFFNIDSHDLPLWRITARYQLSSINSWISQVQCHTYVTGNWFIIDYVTAWIIGFFLIQLLKFKKIHWKPCRAQRRPFSQRIIEWISFIYSGAGIRLPTNYIGEKIMMTSSKGNIIRVTGPLWGESTGQKRLSKQSRQRWFETPSGSFWRHCNVYVK